MTRIYDWNSFIVTHDPRKRFDGLKFERLVMRLLECHYGTGWKATQQSWDGGKDFYRRLGGNMEWAEAKAHRRKLNINALSPTFIMASRNDVEAVLIFSLSDLTRTALQGFSKFCEEAQITLLLHCGSYLDQLVYEYQSLLPGDLLPRRITESPNTRHGVLCMAEYSKDFDIEPSWELRTALRETKAAIPIASGEIISLDILLHNLGPTEAHIHANLGRFEESGCFLIAGPVAEHRIRKHLDEILAPAQCITRRVLLRPLNFSGQKRLPDVEISDQQNTVACIQGKTFEHRCIVQPPFLGKERHADVLRFEHLVAARRKATIAIVEGESGAGKSRFLRECAVRAAKYGYKCIIPEVCGVINDRSGLMTEIISRVFRLPFPIGAGSPPWLEYADGIVSPDKDWGVAERFLYAQSFDWGTQTRALAAATAQQLRRTKTFLYIDDLQRKDAATLEFISLLCDLLDVGDGSHPCGVFLVFNTNELPFSRTAAGLSARLRELSDKQQGRVLYTYLADFSSNDAEDFVNAVLTFPNETGSQTFSGKYPETYSFLISSILKRPLHLYYSLQAIADGEILSIESNCFYVRDIEAFHLAVDEIPRTLTGCLARIWVRVQEQFPDAAHVIRVLSVFGSVEQQHLFLFVNKCRTLPLSRQEFLRSLSCLIESGLVTYHGNTVHFYHHQVQHYILNTHAIFPQDAVVPLLACLQESRLSERYFAAFFWLSHQAATYSPKLLTDAVRYLREADADDYSKRVCQTAFEAIEVNAFSNDYQGILELMLNACKFLLYSSGYREQEVQLRKCVQYIGRAQGVYRPYGAVLSELYHELANAFIGQNCNKDAGATIERALLDLDGADFESRRTRFRSSGLLINRRCVVNKSLGLKLPALLDARFSLRIARDIQDNTLRFRALIDWGYIHYARGPLCKNLLRIWAHAVQEYDNQSVRLRNEMPTAELMRCRLLLLNRKHEDAAVKSEYAFHLCVNRQDIFHATKSLILRAVASLPVCENDADSAAILFDLDKAEDWSVRYKSLRFYWMVFYARAKLHSKVENLRLVAPAYRAALDAYFKTHGGDYVGDADYLLVDILNCVGKETALQWVDDLRGRTRGVDLRLNGLARAVHNSSVEDEFPGAISTVTDPTLGNLPCI